MPHSVLVLSIDVSFNSNVSLAKVAIYYSHSVDQGVKANKLSDFAKVVQ